MTVHTKLKYLPIAVLAVAVSLTSCGGGGDDDPVVTSSTPTTPTTPTTPVDPGPTGTTQEILTAAEKALQTAQDTLAALMDQADPAAGLVEIAEAQVAVNDAQDAVDAAQTAHDEYLAMQPPYVPSVTELFVMAQAASDAATDAGDAATKALKDAMDASAKLSTMSVNGDSMAATANAQAVMDAQAAAAQAVMDAQAALDDAMAAKLHAEALADDDPSKAGLVAALDAAIVVAEAQLKIATDASEGDDLEAYVAAVTGDDEDMPMSPADHGKAVAMAIGNALGGESTAAALPRPDPAIAEAAPGAEDAGFATLVKRDDHQGKTWAEIVGETMKMRIAGTGQTTDEVDAASVDGMTLTSEATVTEDDEFAANGLQVDATYKGIPGTIFCAGSDCVVAADDDAETETGRKLTGSWYFTPDDGDEWYVGTTNDGVTTYAAETMYARFGHWLTVDADGEATVNRFASTGAGTDTNTSGLEFGASDTLAGSATYTGPAAGMSVHKTLGEDGEVTSIYSGAFTADVELVARFGAAPTLGGTIDNFEGNAVDADWSVELERRVFPASGAFIDGKTVATGRDGVWSATAYGAADQRPTGIFGGFNAHFSDGHAAGAYATR